MSGMAAQYGVSTAITDEELRAAAARDKRPAPKLISVPRHLHTGGPVPWILHSQFPLRELVVDAFAASATAQSVHVGTAAVQQARQFSEERVRELQRRQETAQALADLQAASAAVEAAVQKLPWRLRSRVEMVVGERVHPKPLQLQSFHSVVYVDLSRPAAQGALAALRSAALTVLPSNDAFLKCCKIGRSNRGFLAVPMPSDVYHCVCDLMHVSLTIPHVISMLASMFGAHEHIYMIPYMQCIAHIFQSVSHIPAQAPHSDSMLPTAVLAIHLAQEPMRTRFWPNMDEHEAKSMLEKEGHAPFTVANTDAFMFDSRTTHAGPPATHVLGDPICGGNRLFFFLVNPRMPGWEALLTEHGLPTHVTVSDLLRLPHVSPK